VVVIVSVDTDECEAEHVTDEYGNQRPKRGEVVSMGDFHFKHHDCDDDGDHAIAKRFQPVSSQS